MEDCRLVAWEGLPADMIQQVFPDAIYLGGITVEFDSSDLFVYRYTDGAGNFAFAFDRGGRLVSHGSQILNSRMVSALKSAGTKVNS